MENFTVLKTLTVRINSSLEKFEQLYFGGHDIRYRKEGSLKVLNSEDFWKLNPTIVA